jgi:hypothetical protein
LHSSRLSIDRIQGYEYNSQLKNFLKITPTSIENFDKIILTSKQIKQFDTLGQQVIHGSITIDEAILQLRGGNRLTDIIVIMVFVVFVN